MKKKYIALMMTLTLAVSILGGCSGSPAATNTTNGNTLDFSNTTIYGTVTDVDNNKITLSLTDGMNSGRMPGDGMPSESGPKSPEQGGGENGNQTSPAQPDNGDNSQASPEKPDSGDGSQAPPEMPSDGNNNQTPPEKPDGENDSQTPPAQPNGENDNQTSPAQPGSGNDSPAFPAQPDNSTTTFILTITDDSVLQDITLSDITEGCLLSITFDDKNTITVIKQEEISIPNGGNAPSGNAPGQTTVNTGSSAVTIDKDTKESDISYSSENADENALRIEDAVSYSGDSLTIQKNSGDTSDTESSDFYGLNAGVLSLDGADTTITDSTITTNAKGANGLFAYGSDTHVTVSDTSITTSSDNSGGIDVTGGASIEASNLNIETSGNSSAAIRSDRGGGTLNVSQGTYTTNGTGSPAVYSTADITVSDATLTANASEGVVIEGKNSITLENCEVTGNMQGTYHGDENENLHTIMIYQSMSGDADEGEGTLTVNGGSITGRNGDLIYTTNTTSVLNLNNVALTLSNDVLLRVTGNDSSRGWGTAGSNGADMSLFATNQILNGNIIVDEISSLALTISEKSSFEGSINAQQEGGKITVNLDDSSTWKLTADSYITSFEGSFDNIDSNGYTLYIDGVAQNIG